MVLTEKHCAQCIKNWQTLALSGSQAAQRAIGVGLFSEECPHNLSATAIREHLLALGLVVRKLSLDVGLGVTQLHAVTGVPATLDSPTELAFALQVVSVLTINMALLAESDAKVGEFLKLLFCLGFEQVQEHAIKVARTTVQEDTKCTAPLASATHGPASLKH